MFPNAAHLHDVMRLLSTIKMADEVEDADLPPVALSFAASKELTIEITQKQSKEIQR